MAPGHNIKKGAMRRLAPGEKAGWDGSVTYRDRDQA